MVEEATKHCHAETELTLRPNLGGVHFEIRSYMNHIYKWVSFLFVKRRRVKRKYIKEFNEKRKKRVHDYKQRV